MNEGFQNACRPFVVENQFRPRNSTHSMIGYWRRRISSSYVCGFMADDKPRHLIYFAFFAFFFIELHNIRNEKAAVGGMVVWFLPYHWRGKWHLRLLATGPLAKQTTANFAYNKGVQNI